MSDYSDYNVQGNDAFAENPFAENAFAEVPFEPVPFEENPPVQVTPVQQVTTVPAEPVATDGVPTVAAAAASSTADKADEAKKKAEHEAAEAKRKAEFDAKQAEKKRAFAEQLAKLDAMSDEEALNAAIQRTATDTEKLTRRNMKELVTEYIQTKCCEDPAFARLVMHPQKNMVRCFQYITRKAYEYIQDEIKANGIKLGTGSQGYGSDIPDDLCYHWFEEYFRTPNVKEDEDMNDHLAEAFDVKTLSAACNVSVNTLERHFNETLGVTPFVMLRKKRLIASMEYLRNGQTVTEAALKSEFSDYSNYIQLFRKQFGFTPLQYKKKIEAKY